MSPPIVLRGHHVLCLQQFKGLGYSPEFVANMTALFDRLCRDPRVTVRLTTSPDDICAACPNLCHNACHDNRIEAEQNREDQDRLMLDVLALRPGDELTWLEITKRVQLGCGRLPADACGPCRWHADGACDPSSVGNRHD